MIVHSKLCRWWKKSYICVTFSLFPSSFRLGFWIVTAVKVALKIVHYFNGTQLLRHLQNRVCYVRSFKNAMLFPIDIWPREPEPQRRDLFFRGLLVFVVVMSLSSQCRGSRRTRRAGLWSGSARTPRSSCSCAAGATGTSPSGTSAPSCGQTDSRTHWFRHWCTVGPDMVWSHSVQ